MFSFMEEVGVGVGERVSVKETPGLNIRFAARGTNCLENSRDVDIRRFFSSSAADCEPRSFRQDKCLFFCIGKIRFIII